VKRILFDPGVEPQGAAAVSNEHMICLKAGNFLTSGTVYV
jgi:hypothetical protein